MTPTKIYYETITNGSIFDTLQGNNYTVKHDTFESAVEWAESHNVATIRQIGGDYAEYEKCEFCGEWCDVEELNSESYCTRCQVAIRDHGFTTPNDKKRSRY